MTRAKKIAGRIFVAALVLSLVAGLAALVSSRLRVNAEFQPEKAVTYSEYAAGHEVPDSMLFIGTWLIHLDAMTEEYYQKAQESMSEANQYQQYYKSELAGGTWYDLGDADGLSGIYNNGKSVSEDEIGPLYVTYVVGRDGKMTDARTGEEVNPFDIPDPYDLASMTEFQELKKVYDSSFSKDSKGISKYYFDKLSAFWETNLHDEQTDQCDRQLSNLLIVYNQCVADGDSDGASVVMNLMKKVDDVRRAEIFSRLAAVDDSIIDALSKVAEGSEYDAWADENGYLPISPLLKKVSNGDNLDDLKFKEDFKIDNQVMSAINDARTACQTSLSSYLSDELTDSDTSLLGSRDYRLSMEAISLSAQGTDGIREIVSSLVLLHNITDNVVSRQDEELSLINSELLGQAKSIYENAVHAGAGSKYQSVQSQNGSQAALQEALEEQMQTLEAHRVELQFIISAKKMRTTSAEALQMVEEQITWAEGLNSAVPLDGFYSQARNSISSHILWLNELKEAIKNGDSSTDSEMDKLTDQKDDLQKKKQEALDNNDLNLAKKYDAQIAEVDKAIDAEGDRQKELTDKLKLKAQDKISNGLSASAELAALAALSAEDQLKDVADANPDNKEVQKALETAKDNAAKNSTSQGTDSGNTSGSAASGTNASVSAGTDTQASGTGTGSSTGLSQSDIIAIVENYFSEKIDALDESELVIADAAVAELGETGNTNAANLAVTWANRLAGNNNRYTYQAYSSTGVHRYASLQAIAKVTGYRYVFSNTKRDVYLSRQTTVYHFTEDQEKAELSGGSTIVLNEAPKYKYGTLYVRQEVSKELFGCDVKAITGSDYNVLLTQPMVTLQKELLARLKQ